MLLGTVSAIAIASSAASHAGQLPVTVFQTYDPAAAAGIQPGPFSLFEVPVGSLHPTQLNEGFTEVDKKVTGFDLLAPSQLKSNLLTDRIGHIDRIRVELPPSKKCVSPSGITFHLSF